MRYEGPRSRRRGHPDQGSDALARSLGVFSIGLGLAELVAAGPLARTLGLRGQEDVIRAYGVREIGTGIGILGAEDPTPWIWGRVAGDVLDLATLASGINARNGRQANLLAALAMVAGVTAVDVLCARTLSGETRRPLRPVGDYRRRTGFPKGVEGSRGLARDLDVPKGFRSSELLRPWKTA